MHYALKDLEWDSPDDAGWSRASVTLERGDTASNPASTKPERAIHGPAVVTYERTRAGINVIVEDVPS